MSNEKIVIAYYDFDWYEESSRFSEEEFHDMLAKDYMMLQVYTCQDYNVSPMFSYKELVDYIGLEEEDIDDDTLSEAITELTGWLVDSIEVKQ